MLGKKIEIIRMDGEPYYNGRQGIVTRIDDMGQIHGTWGRCALIEDCDQFKIIKEPIEEPTSISKMKPFTEWTKYEFAIKTPNDEVHYFTPSKSNSGVYDEAMKILKSHEDGVDLYVDPDKQDDNIIVYK